MSDIRWNGKKTEELEKVYEEYFDIFNGYPDWYEDFFPDFFTYDEWLYICKLAVRLKKDAPNIIDLILEIDVDDEEEFIERVLANGK